MNGALLVAGTTSDAGKSVLTAGLCRWLARQGVRVAPFKAQNMSLNSAVTRGGAEIGRAQVMQAAAAGIEPDARMNPVLLKPGSDRRSQIVVLGKPVAEVDAVEYRNHAHALRDVALDSLAGLRREFDVVICEGAGSPAEINLRETDIANMGLARAARLPVIVVGDIDRGGVFAALYGTLALLEPADQALVAGFVINKFRGAAELLEPGVRMLCELTARQPFGIIPWRQGLWLDAEDSLALPAAGDALVGGASAAAGDGDVLRVAVVRLPRISNFTDIDALASEPGVLVRFADRPAELADADLVVLPGSRATVADLGWLRARGLAGVIARRARRGQPVLGICGGYQMLAGEISDEVESRAGVVAGLGKGADPMQHALAEFLREPERYETLPAFFTAKRDLLRSALAGTPLELLPCRGSYFQLARYDRVSDEPAHEFAQRLVREIGVATIPLSAFYQDRTDHRVIRFCFAKRDETLLAAAERLRQLRP